LANRGALTEAVASAPTIVQVNPSQGVVHAAAQADPKAPPCAFAEPPDACA